MQQIFQKSAAISKHTEYIHKFDRRHKPLQSNGAVVKDMIKHSALRGIRHYHDTNNLERRANTSLARLGVVTLAVTVRQITEPDGGATGL